MDPAAFGARLVTAAGHGAAFLHMTRLGGRLYVLHTGFPFFAGFTGGSGAFGRSVL